jgi:hypothetical protein
MRCKKARILLSALIDGELSKNERLVLDQHLSSCTSCAREKEELLSVRDAMSAWADEEPSPWLAEEFTEKLRELELEKSTAPARRQAPKWIFGTAVAGAAVALLTVGFFIHSLFPPSPTPSDKAHIPSKDTRYTTVEKRTSGSPNTLDTRKLVGPSINNKQTYLPPTKANTRIAKNDQVQSKEQGRETLYKPIKPYTHAPSKYTSYPKPRVTAGTPHPNREIEEIATAQEVGAAILQAGVAHNTATAEVASNLQDIKLAMSETVEQVRGSIMEAIDTAKQSNNLPIQHTTDYRGGTTL